MADHPDLPEYANLIRRLLDKTAAIERLGVDFSCDDVLPGLSEKTGAGIEAEPESPESLTRLRTAIERADVTLAMIEQRKTIPEGRGKYLPGPHGKS